MAGKPEVSYQFIDEQERQVPNSQLNVLIRSIARKHGHSIRRSLNASGSTVVVRRSIKAKERISFTENTGDRILGRSDEYSTTGKEESNHQQRPKPKFAINDPSKKVCRLAPLQIYRSGASCRLPSMEFICGTQKMDPFNSFPVQMKPHMKFLLHYYTSVCAWSLPKQANGYTNSHTRWLPLCMKNRMAFKSTLLISETCSRSNAGLDPWSLFAVNLLVEIVELITTEIDRPEPNVSDVMLATIINIARVELTHGDPAKYRNHIKGLNEILKVRDRLRDYGLDKFMREKIIWIKQLGGDLSCCAEDNPSPILEISADEENTTIDVPSSQCSSVSDEMIGILKLIRLLTELHTDSGAPVSTFARTDFQMKCLAIQDQLEELDSAARERKLFLEDACIFAAHVYIDLILLKTPAERIITGKMNGKLQGSLIHLSKNRRSKENDDFLLWISATASATIGSGRVRTLMVAVVGRFNQVLTRMERDQEIFSMKSSIVQYSQSSSPEDAGSAGQ